MTNEQEQPDDRDRQTGTDRGDPQAEANAAPFNFTETFTGTTSTGPSLSGTVTYATITDKDGVVHQIKLDPLSAGFTMSVTTNMNSWSSAPITAKAIYDAWDELKQPRLPESEETMPILAKRAARLRLDQIGRVSLWSLGNHGRQRIHDDATCHVRQWPPSVGANWAAPPGHVAPELQCTCGFYGVVLDADAQHSAATVELDVEFSGRVIIHERGYRAEHQQILAVHMPRCCCGLPTDNLCGAPSEYVLFDDDLDGGRVVTYLCAECKNCMRWPWTAVSLLDVQDHLGLPVDSDRWFGRHQSDWYHHRH